MTIKYEEWLDKYTFENCSVDRGQYGKFLVSYLAGEHDGFVLNLNGEWGSGKTEFLKRSYTELHKCGHPVIYIDAWESDFTNDPLLVVSSELLNQLSDMFEVTGSDIDKLTEHLGKFAKGTSIAVSGFLTHQLLGESSLGIEMTKALFDKSPKDFLNSMKEGYSEQIAAIKDVRLQLEQLANNLAAQYRKKTPVVVLVDELDRCRPNYAIEMLEVIKHFFTTKHFVFVIATDTNQLRNSIKAVYGDNFNSATYLRRFFNREARLGDPNLNKFINTYSIDIPTNISLYPICKSMSGSRLVHLYLTWIIQAFELTLRDTDQLFAKIKSSLRTMSRDTSINHQVNIFTLIIALVEFDNDSNIFLERGNSNAIDEWYRQDFEVAHPESEPATTFQRIYSLNMNHSVKHACDHTDHFRNDFQETCLAKDINKFRLSRKKESRLTLDIDQSIRESMTVKKQKIWLWDDYKEIVKLSSTLS